MPLLERYLQLEQRVEAIESGPRRGYPGEEGAWLPLVEMHPLLEEMARLRKKISPAERRALCRREFDWEPYPGPFFHAGERAFFEYHCEETDKSSDAFLWYHSCQHCTVLRLEGRDEEALHGPGYRVRFDDGVEWWVNSDELFKRALSVSWFRSHNRDERWYRGEGCRPAESLYDVRLELRRADLEVSGRAAFEATLERHHNLGIFLNRHPELQIGVEIIPDEGHQDAYLFFNAGKIPQVVLLLTKLDQPLWHKRRLLYGNILDVPEAFPKELAELVAKWYGWRVKRGGT